MCIGDIFLDRLTLCYDIPAEVMITEIYDKEMWGMTGKEMVKIIKYKYEVTKKSGECTDHTFVLKFISKSDWRDAKLNFILN